MGDDEILLLRRDEMSELLDLPAIVDRIAAEMRSAPSPSLREHVTRPDGAFHLVCGAGGPSHQPLLALKVNRRFDDPTLGRTRGLVLLVDAADGRPLALMDSAAITMMRTAALATIAVEHLARSDADSLLVVGSGKLASGIVEAALLARPFSSIDVWSRSPEHAEDTASAVARQPGRDVRAVTDLAAAAASAAVIVTITAAKSPLLHASDVRPGALVVALGSDGPGKQEIDVELLARARVVVDDLGHTSANGELGHAIRQGMLTADDVHGRLADIVRGERAGRTSDDEIFVFDSTGTALQDLAAAAFAFERAESRSIGVRVSFG